jgi:hypothetical protein
MEILKLLYFAIKAYSINMLYFLTSSILIMFLIILFIMYRRIVSAQISIYGEKVKTSLGDLFSTSILSGILGGFFGAIIITIAGITFYDFTGIEYIFIISLMLMLIHPRYVCFSYSGGLIGLVVLINNYLLNGGYVDKNNVIAAFIHNNLNFDVTAMVALIAILHLIEGVLVWFDGSRGALPVFTKRNGKVVGAFVMQRFWIVPILLYGYIQDPQMIGDQVATPSWWPLIRPPLTVEQLKSAIFAVVAFLPALLGYSDFAVTDTPKEKARKSAINLLGFSLILLILAVISVRIYAFKYIAVLFAPLGHDAMILYQRYREKSNEALLKYSKEGIVVVDTIPDSPADKMGIQSGDTIVGINNVSVKTIEEIELMLSQYATFIWIDVINRKGEKRTVEHSNYINGVKDLGIINVPKDEYGITLVEEKEGYLARKMKSFLKKEK